MICSLFPPGVADLFPASPGTQGVQICSLGLEDKVRQRGWVCPLRWDFYELSL